MSQLICLSVHQSITRSSCLSVCLSQSGNQSVSVSVSLSRPISELLNCTVSSWFMVNAPLFSSIPSPSSPDSTLACCGGQFLWNLLVHAVLQSFPSLQMQDRKSAGQPCSCSNPTYLWSVICSSSSCAGGSLMSCNSCKINQIHAYVSKLFASLADL